MYISNPNLPKEKSSAVLIDYRAEKAFKALKAFGIKVIVTPNVNIAYSAISGHADIAFHHLNEQYAVAAPDVYDYYCSIFGKEHIICGDKKIESTYPGDAAYNIARIGNTIFHNLKYTDKNILEYYRAKGTKLINIKQGYSKCSVCIVSETALITEDISIQKAALKESFDVLLIGKGAVSLKGFPYGFIGGASGLISNDVLLFNGKIENHPDFCRIKSFCANYGVKTMSAGNYTLEDIGSIISIK